MNRRSLTRRQQQIVACVGRGMSYAQIAAQIYVSERTVRREVARMKEAAGAATLAALLRELTSQARR